MSDLSFDPSLEYFKRVGSPVIAAATAAGGPVSVLRLSGQNLRPFFKSIFKRSSFDDRQVEYLKVADIDKALVLYFKGPRSFTGEDVLEIQGHGVPALQEAILDEFIKHGARRALPGEFSFRAVYHGKMSLAEAEFLNEALSQEAMTASGAKKMLNVDPSSQAKNQKIFYELKDSVVSARGRLESAIDFSEAEEEQASDVDSALKYLENLESRLNLLLSSFEQSAQKLTEPRVVIVGEANAGKSTLLNQLSGSERAIVSDVAGTTRDYIETRAKFKNTWVRMIDTAGFRELNSSEMSEHDELERLGLKKGEELLRSASLVFLVKNATKGELSSELTRLLRVINKPTVLIHSFADQCKNKLLEKNCFDLRNSALEIRQYLESEMQKLGFFSGKDFLSQELLMSSRQLKLLEKVQNELSSAREILKTARALEIAAELLKEAEKYLNRCIGQDLDDSYIGAIFSQFCLGK